MTKREYKQHKADWAKGIEEGRIVAFNDGQSFRMFPTLAMRNVFIAGLEAQGLPYRVVRGANS